MNAQRSKMNLAAPRAALRISWLPEASCSGCSTAFVRVATSGIVGTATSEAILNGFGQALGGRNVEISLMPVCWIIWQFFPCRVGASIHGFVPNLDVSLSSRMTLSFASLSSLLHPNTTRAMRRVYQLNFAPFLDQSRTIEEQELRCCVHNGPRNGCVYPEAAPT